MCGEPYPRMSPHSGTRRVAVGGRGAVAARSNSSVSRGNIQLCLQAMRRHVIASGQSCRLSTFSTRFSSFSSRLNTFSARFSTYSTRFSTFFHKLNVQIKYLAPTRFLLKRCNVVETLNIILVVFSPILSIA